jgi:hypothetical protein
MTGLLSFGRKEQSIIVPSIHRDDVLPRCCTDVCGIMGVTSRHGGYYHCDSTGDHGKQAQCAFAAAEPSSD